MLAFLYPGPPPPCPAGSTRSSTGSPSRMTSASSTAPTVRERDTSPMIARELDAFFAGHADPYDGSARLQRADDLALAFQRQRRLPSRLLGGASVPRRRLLGRSGVRRGDACSGLGEGLPSGHGPSLTRTTTRRSASPSATSTSTAGSGRVWATSSRSTPSAPRATSEVSLPAIAVGCESRSTTHGHSDDGPPDRCFTTVRARPSERSGPGLRHCPPRCSDASRSRAQ